MSLAGNLTAAASMDNAVFVPLFLTLFFLPPCCLGLLRLARPFFSRHQGGRRKRRTRPLDDSLRARVQLFLYVHTNIGAWWDVSQALLALLSCLHYIVGTYTKSCDVFSRAADTTIELSVFAAFSIDYALSLYLSRDRLWYVLSPVALADLLSILPTLLQLAMWLAVGSAVGCDADSFFFAKCAQADADRATVGALGLPSPRMAP